MVSRTGYTGELGYEVFCHPDDAPAVWDAVWDAGGAEPPVAVRAGRARHPADRSGTDRVGQRVRRPDRSVRGGHRVHRGPRGDEDFVGREALHGTKSAPSARARGAAARGQRGGRARRPGVRGPPAGRASSPAAPGPRCSRRTSRSAGSRWVPRLGTELEVGKLDGIQKRIAAEVVRFPFYDPRQDATAVVRAEPVIDAFSPSRSTRSIVTDS